MAVLHGEMSRSEYGDAALDLLEQAGAGVLPPIPELAKERGLHLVERLAEPKIVQKYPESLAEAFGVSYRFAVAEAWEDLDRAYAQELLDEGLSLVREQHLATSVPDPLELDDPEQRVHFSTLGLAGNHAAFERAREYVESRAAFQRLATLDDLHLRMGLMAYDVKGRHADAFMRSQMIAWRAGKTLGILNVMGEVPA